MTPLARPLHFLPLILLLALAACGRVNEEFPSLSREESGPAQVESLVKNDPAGPIPRPQVPSLPQEESSQITPPGEKIPYRVQVNPPTSPEEPQELKDIKSLFEKTADLYILAEKPALSQMTLTRRLRSSLTKGQDILKSAGYYEGQVTGWMEKKEGVEETVVVINFQLGPLYHLGLSQVRVNLESQPEPTAGQPTPPAPDSPKQAAPSPEASAPPNPPTVDLVEAGWVSGQPALADRVLDLVTANATIWAARGYPHAKTLSARHFLDPEKKLLNTEVTMEPGFFARMGPLVVTNEGSVEAGYIQNLVNWKIGQIWNQALVDSFVAAMFQTGLFKSVEVTIGEEDAQGQRPVLVETQDTPFRTVSGSVNFDSDFGPGLVLSWEHRNLTGWGDRLRLELPVWADLLQFGASYVRPYFLSREQSLLLDFSAIKENADAYSLSALSTSAGLERRLTRHLTGLFQARLEVGSLKELDKEESEYKVAGLPLTFDWDYSDDLLNPTKGSRVKISLQPYWGDYFEQFEILKSRLDASHYFSLLDQGRLILALRAAAGGIWGAERSSLPPTLRFYGGGGGSMRGYEYQSVGPRDERDKPDGGGAMAEVSGEFRWRWSETMGATVFVDGGMVYDRPNFSEVGQSFLWGGGVGFRYYTPIGPFRLDLATPLTPRSDDAPLQFYLSLGQSF
ncbi:MAG: BamA/TamA family outer membrane protein [Deltaproteobacteria bacterium]|jgi:translocation and assembly module TamA|nr:BamA/TamA family outer membrane protein [Deltaproteobacteria bacterium]